MATHRYARSTTSTARSSTGRRPRCQPAIAHEGWEITAGQPGQEAAFLAALSRDFPGRWRAIIADTFARGGSAEDLVALRDPAGEIAGFLATWRPERAFLGPGLHWLPALGPRPGAIGPLGIASTARGKGLGLALVAGAASVLREHGVLSCAIDWVGTELLDFYARLGFHPSRTYWRCGQKALAT